MTWLPPLLSWQSEHETFDDYLDRVYAAFSTDWLGPRPMYDGRPFGLKRMPERNGRSATFYHLTTEGRSEESRRPEAARCERIRWPRALIENHTNADVCVWTNLRRRERSHLFALSDFSYVVVVRDRGSHLLLWTAHCVEQEHRRRKHRREYEASRKG